MKKRSLVATIAAVACIAAVGIGSTFAYFTDSTKVLGNQFTLGDVKIELSETFDKNGDGEVAENEKFVAENNDLEVKYDGKILPMESIAKAPIVTVKEGSNDAWIVVKVDYDSNVFTLNFNTGDNGAWKDLGNGFYGYKTTVAANATTTPVFTTATVKNLTEGQNKDTAINVEAYAIQASMVADIDAAFANLASVITPAQ